MEYMIGQVQELTQDCEVERGLSGTKITLPKGTKAIIGADKFAHWEDGSIQPLGENDVVKGYSASGLASWIGMWLLENLPLREMLKKFDVESTKFVDEIEAALEDLGFYEDTCD